MPETEYLFIDSGGYETNDSFDLSGRNKFNYHVMPWDKDKMKEKARTINGCKKGEILKELTPIPFASIW